MDESTIVERLCPDCKVPLELIMPKVLLHSDQRSLFSDETVVVDIYACPRCGLMRVYHYNQRYRQEKAIEEAKKPAPPPQPEASGDPWDKKKKEGGGLFDLFRSED